MIMVNEMGWSSQYNSLLESFIYMEIEDETHAFDWL